MPSKAEREDNLDVGSNDAQAAAKVPKERHFTINQLSLPLPAAKNTAAWAHASTAFNFELQSLALRTRKIYLHHTPSVPSHDVELYLDIEGVAGSRLSVLDRRCGLPWV
jgi:hypothetical protein